MTMTYPAPPTGGGLYVIRLSDSHFYGGRTRSLKIRWQTHLRELLAGNHANPRMQRVFGKYRQFEPKVLERTLSGDVRVALEQIWLDQNWGTPGCVNISKDASAPPSTLGRNHTRATRAKISAALTGRIFSQPHREALSAALTGKSLPPAVRQKIQETCEGINQGPHSPDRCRANSEAHKGLTHPEATKSRMARSQKSRWIASPPDVREKQLANLVVGAMTGRTHSEATKQKMRAAHARRKAQITANANPFRKPSVAGADADTDPDKEN